MTPAEYVKNVLVTEARDFKPVIQRLNDVKNLRLLHACIGINSELAEIIEIERAFDLKSKIDRINLMEEIADIFWYIGIAADSLNAVEKIFEKSERLSDPIEYDDDLANYIANFSINVGQISGELTDLAVKKSIFYGKQVDENKIVELLNDIHFNAAYLLEAAGFTVEDARERNIAKLRARYGEKFTEAAANERNLVVEREILEKITD